MRLPTSLVILATFLGACATEPTTTAPSGAETFATHCASCHGAQGEGDGPVAGTMRVSMPNLRTLSERNDGSFPAESIRAYIDGRDLPLSHGDRYMPVWGDVFEATGPRSRSELAAAQRIDTVITFLRELQYQ